MRSKVYFWGDDDSLREVEDVERRWRFLLGSDTYDIINAERSKIRLLFSGQQSTSLPTDEQHHICNVKHGLSTQNHEEEDISQQQIVKRQLKKHSTTTRTDQFQYRCVG